MECVPKLDILREDNSVKLYCYNDKDKKIQIKDRDYCLYKTMQTVNNLIDEVTKLQVLHGDIERLVTTLEIEKLEKNYPDISSLLNDKQCYACISSLSDEFISFCIHKFTEEIYNKYSVHIYITKPYESYRISNSQNETLEYVEVNMCMKYLYEKCMEYAQILAISEEK